LAGRKPAYGVRLTSSGSLGTWAKKFWRYFRDRDVLIDNIVRMLHESWDTQNYIGIHFLRLMPHLADTPERKQKLIEGLKSAIRNDAHLLKGKLGELPSDWVEQIKCRLDPGPGQSL
jgi:hypothetical protein